MTFWKSERTPRTSASSSTSALGSGLDHRLHPRAQIGLTLDDLEDAEAAQTLHHQAHAAVALLHGLVNDGDRAHREQAALIGRVSPSASRCMTAPTSRPPLDRLLDETDRRRPPGAQRQHRRAASARCPAAAG